MANFELAGRCLRVAWAQDQSKPAMSVLPPGLTAAAAAAQAAAAAAKAAGGAAAAAVAARMTASGQLQASVMMPAYLACLAYTDSFGARLVVQDVLALC